MNPAGAKLIDRRLHTVPGMYLGHVDTMLVDVC
jgi:hypothetical protein